MKNSKKWIWEDNYYYGNWSGETLNGVGAVEAESFENLLEKLFANGDYSTIKNVRFKDIGIYDCEEHNDNDVEIDVSVDKENICISMFIYGDWDDPTGRIVEFKRG